MAGKILIGIFFSLVICRNTQAQLRVLKILPSVTDEAIDSYTEPGDEHYIYLNDTVNSLNKLFVFLPGTGGRGKNPRFIVPFASSLGYHAIALTYPSDVALAQICRNNTDENCFDKGRQEIAFGDDVSLQWNVNKANSIENRLRKLLIYLIASCPKDNWSQFLINSNEINWNKICIAGQSQGGGHAAFIAQQKNVDRVIMFASPKDYSLTFSRPAGFLHKEMATPINRFYGFVHSADEVNGCTWAEQRKIFTLMGFDRLGMWENVDNMPPPYNHTHTLTSTKNQNFPHGSVINDTGYSIVWKYLMTGD